MGWRIRKSIKVAPGTRINISGSGVSATTRLGKTGISHRTQLVGGRKSGGSGKSGGSSTRETGSGSGKKRGCLGSVIGFVLVLGLLGALFGGGDKTEKATPSPAPSAALAAVSPAPAATPKPTATPRPTASPEPTPGPLDELQAKVDGLQEQLENGEFENMERDYVLNTSTLRFHLPGCRGVRDMRASNRQDFHGTRAEVEAMGYTPCGICKP